MTAKEIAETISAEDKELILNSGKSIRRSRIEVIQDESDKIDTEIDDQLAADKASRTRTAVKREWPAVGAEVLATNPWTGVQYPVEVVANKKRKSGVEFRLPNGKQFHSPSPMCQYLFRKRVSNGWDCLSWDISGDGEVDDD